MSTDEKRYDFVTQQQRYTNDKVFEAFSLYVKLAAAIVAGYVWLHTQSIDGETKRTIDFIAPWIFSLIAIYALTVILVNLRSWWGYCTAESELVGKDNVPPPKFPRSCAGHLIMIAVITIMTTISWCYI